MKLRWKSVTLELKNTLRTTHGGKDWTRNVFVYVDEGIGEASAVSYHGETRAGVMVSLLRAALSVLPKHTGPINSADQIRAILGELPSGSQAARAAIDIALHDLWGKQTDQPLYQLLGVSPDTLPQTSFTIGIDKPEIMVERAKNWGMPILKVKLGRKHDDAIVRAIREVTPARLRVDANGGWSFEQAVAIIPRLADYGVEFVEQPLRVGDLEGLRRLRALKLPVPIFVDESVETAREVKAHAGLVDGVVIKLMKTGGIQGALEAIHTARSLNMQVMLSCMTETSVGVTAAAHLGGLCDYLDLDSSLRIRHDPHRGLNYEGATLTLPSGPGLGLTPRAGERPGLKFSTLVRDLKSDSGEWLRYLKKGRRSKKLKPAVKNV